MTTKYYLRFGYRFNDYEPFDTYTDAERTLITAIRRGEPHGIVYMCAENLLTPIREAFWQREKDGTVVAVEDFNPVRDFGRVVPEERPKPYDSARR